MNRVFSKIWQLSPHSFDCRKVGGVQLSSNFFLLFVITNFTFTFEIWTRFLKNIHQKWIYYTEEKQGFEIFLIFLRRPWHDTYFENIQTISIFLKCYCCVSHVKNNKIIFFGINNSWEEIFFISRFNQTSLKETWDKNVFRLWNLLNVIVLTSKLLLQKTSCVTFCENIVRRKQMW